MTAPSSLMNGALLKCLLFALFFCELITADNAVHSRRLQDTPTPTVTPTPSPSVRPTRVPTAPPSLRPSLKPTKPPIGPPTFLPTFLVTERVEDVLEFAVDVTLHGVFWSTLDEPSLAALNGAAAQVMGVSVLAVKATQTFGVFEANNDAVDDGAPAPAVYTAAYAKETLALAKVDAQFTSYACGVQHTVYLNMVDFPSAQSTQALYDQLKGKLLNATYIYDADPDVYNAYSSKVRAEAVAQGSTMLTIAKVAGTVVGEAQITPGSATRKPSFKPTAAPGNATLSAKKDSKDLSGTGELGVLGVLGLVAAVVYMFMCCGCVVMYQREKQRQKAEQAEANQLAAAHAAAHAPSQKGSVAGDMEEEIPEDRYRDDFYAINNNSPNNNNNNMYAPTNGAHYPHDMRGNGSVVEGYNPNNMNNGDYNGGYNQNGNGNSGYGNNNNAYGNNNYNDNNNNNNNNFGNGGNNNFYGGNGYNDAPPSNLEMTPFFSVQTDQHNTYPLPPQHGAGFNSFYGHP